MLVRVEAVSEQDDTPEPGPGLPEFTEAMREALFHRAVTQLERLQAVAALYPKTGERFGYWHGNSGNWYCMGCESYKGDVEDEEANRPHADGCPVGRYEEGK